MVQLKGRPGYYAQRAVPLDLQQRLGKKLWRKKAGNTLSEARLFLVAFLAETEALIQQHRGQLSPHDRERLLLRGKPPEEVFQSDYWGGSPEEARELADLPPVVPETVDQIIERATRLKSPATGTIREWRNAFDHFTNFTGSIYPLSATKADAIGFRDHLLSKSKISTKKKIIRFTQGH